MASSQSGPLSTATPHQNPFLSQDDEPRKFTSDVPLGGSSGVTASDPTLVGRPLIPVVAAVPAHNAAQTTGGVTGATTSSTSSRSAFPAAPLDTDSNVSSSIGTGNSGLSSSSSTGLGSSTQPTLTERAQAAADNVKYNIQNAETKPGLAGNLAPDQSPLSPSETPAGTEHVTNIISGLGGAIASAPAAALEAVSPVAASKVSDAAAAISARLPAMSLADVQAKATSLANAAYAQIPEGTAQTVQGYAGAAVQKAQEVLPPALGGSATTGNTGSGELAKPPSQLANEYGSSAAQSAQGAAGSAAQTISAYATAAQQKAAELAGIAQQKAGETAQVAQQNASAAATTAQQKASELGQQASNAAGQAQNRASELGQQASQSASATAGAAQQKAAEASQSASQTASNYTSSAQRSTTGTTGSTHVTHEATGPGQYSYSRESGPGVSQDFPASSDAQVDRTL